MKIHNAKTLKLFIDKHGLSEADIAAALDLAPSKNKGSPKSHRGVHYWIKGERTPEMGWNIMDMVLKNKFPE